MQQFKKDNSSPRINHQITARVIRLVNNDGTMHGVISLKEAMQMAQEGGFDLVEISPQVDPIVCKLLDYGKYKYELQKKLHQAKKKQKHIALKELTLRPNIDSGAYQVKLKHLRKFLQEGARVKISCAFRGREIIHKEIGFEILNKLIHDTEDIAKLESKLIMEGKKMLMILVSK